MASFPRLSVLPCPRSSCTLSEQAVSKQTLLTLFSPEYWQGICTDLHADSNSAPCGPAISLREDLLQDLRNQVASEGVTQVRSEQLPLQVDLLRAAKGVVALMQHGWPAPFLVLYDEVWTLIHQMSDIMLAATGNACNMDILAWFVDPNNGDVGFSPHRDRQPDDTPATFRPDGSAMYATCWMPFTDACPENSCLYVIPRWADPGYFDGDADEDDAPSPLQLALPNKEAYQHIRACPAPAGSAVIFTHRTIHWGSKGRKGYHTPRVCISFGCADDAYEPPYFSREHLPLPPFRLRVALVCAQMIIYHERFPFSSKMLSMFHRAFKQEAQHFDPTYRQKVLSELVAASQDVLAREASERQTKPCAQPEGGVVPLVEEEKKVEFSAGPVAALVGKVGTESGCKVEGNHNLSNKFSSSNCESRKSKSGKLKSSKLKSKVTEVPNGGADLNGGHAQGVEEGAGTKKRNVAEGIEAQGREKRRKSVEDRIKHEDEGVQDHKLRNGEKKANKDGQESEVQVLKEEEEKGEENGRQMGRKKKKVAQNGTECGVGKVVVDIEQLGRGGRKKVLLQMETEGRVGKKNTKEVESGNQFGKNEKQEGGEKGVQMGAGIQLGKVSGGPIPEASGGFEAQLTGKLKAKIKAKKSRAVCASGNLATQSKASVGKGIKHGVLCRKPEKTRADVKVSENINSSTNIRGEGADGKDSNGKCVNGEALSGKDLSRKVLIGQALHGGNLGGECSASDEELGEDEDEKGGWDLAAGWPFGKGGDGGCVEDDGYEDDIMEDVLEAMLDAEIEGAGGAMFRDDFDEVI